MHEEQLRQVFREKQAALRHALLAPGSLLSHGPTIGSGRERLVIDHLAPHFPAHALARGQILAPEFQPSSEWDIVICDQNAGGLVGIAGAIPIESVLAAISVKSQMNSAAIDECAAAAAQLRGMLAQDGAAPPVPAVFAFGLDGMRGTNVVAALTRASERYGRDGRIDSALVLGKLTVVPGAGGYVATEDEDAFARWVVSLDAAVRRAPRRPAVLATYLFGAEPPDEEPPSLAVPETTPPPSGGGSSGAIADRLSHSDLTHSRIAQRLKDELAVKDAAAAARFEVALARPQELLQIAEHGSGDLLEATARLLAAREDHDAAATAFLRRAAEEGTDRTVALVAAAACLRAAGDERKSDRLLEEMASADPQAVMLRIDEIRRERDPALQLAALDHVHSDIPSTRSFLAALRGAALTHLDRDADAVAVLRPALAERWTIELAERLGIALLRLAREDRGSPAATDVVAEAIAVLEESVSELLALGLKDLAAQMDTRLMRALALAGRHDVVADIASCWIGQVDSITPTTRVTLANALLDLDEPERARRLAPRQVPDDQGGRLLSARLVLADSASRATAVKDAVATLDELLEDADAERYDRLTVAEARAIAAAEGRAPWNPRADELITPFDPLYRDILYSQFLLRTGDKAGAETVLLRHSDTPAGIRALIDLAADMEEWGRVVALIEGLGDSAPAVERLRRADALQRLGRVAEAQEGWRSVIATSDGSKFFKERAWFRLTHSLTEHQQWERLAAASQEWHDAMPDSPLALWVAADALQRVNHAKEAWELVKADGRKPSTPPQRHLVAGLATQALPLPAALKVITELSDETDRDDEYLEALIITCSAGEDKTAVSGALEQRVRQTYADFPERFPDSQLVQSFKAPSTEEEWAAFAERHLSERRALAEEMQAQVERGQGALAMFCLLGGTALSVWLDSRLLPLVAPVSDVHEREIEAAAGALGGAAVWDSSALAVLSLLDDDAADSIVRALPASSCPRAVQAEVHDLSRTVAERAPGRSPGTLSVQDGRPVILPRSAEEASAFVQRAKRVRQLSERLSVFDPDLASGGELAEALADREIHGSAASWLGATLLASQRDAALYCDDRYIRAWAYRLGISTFGTAALLVALERRGLVTRDTTMACGWRLLGAGGRHLAVTETDLIARIAADGYRLSQEVEAVLLDPDGWSSDANRQREHWHQALVSIWKADPPLLPQWVADVVERVARTTGLRRPAVALLFMGSAVLTDDPDAGYIRALCVAWQRCNLERFSVGDPVQALVEELGHVARENAPGMMPYMVLWVLTRLPLGEQLRLLGVSAGASRLPRLPE